MQIEDLSSEDGTLKGPATGAGDHLNCLERAEAYILANLKDPFSLLDLTEAVGTSPSTLLRAFSNQHGVSPMQYVKRLRLEAVRRSLLAADPQNGTVGRVASEFGFRQLGRFSAEYRSVFGELPSVTLRHNQHRLRTTMRL